MLVPFSTGKESLAQIRLTYEKLVGEKRLVVPGQVAREFAVNRPTKLSELYHAISLKQDLQGPKAGNYPLLDASTSYAIIQRMEGDLAKLLKEYRAAVSVLLGEIQSWTWDDPVSTIYRDVLTADVVHDPKLDDERVNARWLESVREKVPPGYKDATKEVNADGDMRVWLTILDIAEARKSDVVLVSGDGKADWWHRSHSKSLYPRFELVDEFRRISGGKSFHICPFSEFLKLYGAARNVVAEVKSSERTLRLETLPRSSRGSATGLLAEQAVYAWLRSQYPFLTCTPEESKHSSMDFLLSERGGASTAILVKYVSDTQAFPYRATAERASDMADKDTFGTDNVWLFLVTDTETAFDEMRKRLDALTALPHGVDYIPALLREDGRLDVRDIFNVLPEF